MRIIAGIAKGMPLIAPRGAAVRPTSDRVREAIFSSLGARVPGATVLDLFAGTGALGLEAASRGAQHVVLVEKLRVALEAIAKNAAEFLRRAGAQPEIEVRRTDAFEAVRDLAGKARKFSLIFADPPYGTDAQALLEEPELLEVLAPDGMLVVECARREALAVPSAWRCRREVSYGETHVAFLVPFRDG
jgi:16S rRNA (guanine(966)-N(2))-methyltransferase RsmD